MAKELPYFKFEPNQWENGNIQMCTDIAKAHFINICSAYWSRVGSLSEKLALIKCCSGNQSTYNELLDNGIVKSIDGMIVISFLDLQLSEFMDIKRSRSESGKKGGMNGAVRPEIERVQGNQLYLLLCKGNGEEFLKIGTTSKCVSRRYSGKMPYEYMVIFQLLTDDYLSLESEYCELFAKYQYKPKLNFQGQKECYDMNFFDEITQVLSQRHSIAVAPLKRSEAIRGDERKEEKRKSIEERKSEFYKLLSTHVSVYGKEMVREFYDHWTEHGPRDKKMKFEKEKSFDPVKRLATWKRNEKRFGQTPKPTFNPLAAYGL